MVHLITTLQGQIISWWYKLWCCANWWRKPECLGKTTYKLYHI